MTQQLVCQCGERPHIDGLQVFSRSPNEFFGLCPFFTFDPGDVFSDSPPDHLHRTAPGVTDVCEVCGEPMPTVGDVPPGGLAGHVVSWRPIPGRKLIHLDCSCTWSVDVGPGGLPVLLGEHLTPSQAYAKIDDPRATYGPWIHRLSGAFVADPIRHGLYLTQLEGRIAAAHSAARSARYDYP